MRLPYPTKQSDRISAEPAVFVPSPLAGEGQGEGYWQGRAFTPHPPGFAG